MMLSSHLISVSKTSSRSLLHSERTASTPTIVLRSASKLARNEQTREFRIGLWCPPFRHGNQKETTLRNRILKYRCGVNATDWKLLLSQIPARPGDAIQQSRNMLHSFLSRNGVLDRKLVKVFDTYDGLSFAVRVGPRVFVRKNSGSSEETEYDIDPITNRKVPRKNSGNPTEATKESSDISVKTFKEHRARHSIPSNSSVHATTEWGNCSSYPKSTMDNPCSEELATYKSGFYHDEPEEWYPKNRANSQVPYSKSYGTKQGCEHRTESDQANLMEYETKYQIDYEKGFYHDEPLEWYPRKLSVGKEAERAKLEDDYVQRQKISGQADEIYANRVCLLRAEQDRRRVQEIGRKAREILAHKTALAKAEEERRRTQNIIRKADEIHADLVKNEAIEQERRKKQAITDRANEIHADWTRLELAEKAHRRLNDLSIENSELRDQAATLQDRIAARIKKVDASISPAPGLTGNFVRDFPDEVKESWKPSQGNSGAQLSKVNKADEKAQSAANAYVDGRALKEAFSRHHAVNRMETSLDRTLKKADMSAKKGKAEKEQNDAILREIVEKNDEYSKEPMGLETSYARECEREGKPIGQVWSSSYGTSKPEQEPVDEYGYSKKPMGLETSYARECEREGKPVGEVWSSSYGNTPQPEDEPVDEYGYSKKPMGLETSYTRECEREGKPIGEVWSSSYGDTPKPAKSEDEPVDEYGYSKKPMGLETSYARECEREGKPMGQIYSTSYGESVKNEPIKNEPIKNEPIEKEPIKNEPEVDSDGYSTKPMGLQTSYAEECKREGKPMGELHSIQYRTSSRAADDSAKNRKKMDRKLIRNIREIYEQTYGAIDTKHRHTSESHVAKGKEATSQIVQDPTPNQYKILAYDPTMQSVSIADATSVVTDSASALTPAEVLLRLSNPVKFFPHFGPLQAQGYEIVSGNGDLLVFRKVRAGEPSSKTQDVKVNPIDGMESKPVAATGNFASPTGFVNHDMPVDPPFKSNIDVRREEPVFSGTRSTWNDAEEGTKRKPQGRGKRLVLGAFWVAACSYAVGVVAEFFRTGGIDGAGPVGF